MDIDKPYDYRNCQSLFGYAMVVHARSGGICVLCGAGRGRIDFDLWRQMTVEHLIGESQGGYLSAVRTAVQDRFPDLSPIELALLVEQIDKANTVTACSFCNATTSRDRAEQSMAEVLAVPGTPEVVLAHVGAVTVEILERKRRVVSWKLESVRAAFESMVVPGLEAARTAARPGG